MDGRKSRKYKPSIIELTAFKGLALSGAVRIDCHSSAKAIYQQNRMITIANSRGVKDMIATSTKLSYVYMWMKAKFPTPHLQPLIIDVANQHIYDIADTERHSSHDQAAIIEAMGALKTPVSKPDTGQQLLKLAKQQLSKGVITQEQYDQILSQYGG